MFNLNVCPLQIMETSREIKISEPIYKKVITHFQLQDLKEHTSIRTPV
jgi:hypothetical protein